MQILALGRFEDHGDGRERGIVEDVGEAVKVDMAPADVLVAVLAAARLALLILTTAMALSQISTD